MKEGWICLHRKISEDEIWFLEKFTKAQAWIDLILNANHKKKVIDIRGNLIKIERGQIGWSELTMAERWKWSRNKVRRFLSWLEHEGKAEQQKLFKLTTITTILKYEEYQTIQQKDNRKTTDDTTEGTQTTMLNNIKDIVGYLNLKTNKKYQANSKKTISVINARMNDGFTVEDFKKVIDVKTEQWLGDAKNDLYLRPETLFGTKFEGYLNQNPISSSSQSLFKRGF